MPSMVSVNRWALKWGMPFAIAAYVLFLFWQDTVYFDENKSVIVDRHLANTSTNRNVDGLILGGSNAYFSLSAEILERETHRKWYNAALMNEGFSSANYEAFIDRLTQGMDLLGVRQVVYSTISPYRLGEISNREHAHTTITGQRGFQIKPQGSALEHALQTVFNISLLPHSGFPLPNRYGDFVFTGFACTLSRQTPKIERETPEVVVPYLLSRAKFLRQKFPRAAITIVLPSEFQFNQEHDSHSFESTVRARFLDAWREASTERDGDRTGLRLIFQPPYESADQICDYNHHASEQGRLWRTRNLIDSLQMKPI